MNKKFLIIEINIMKNQMKGYTTYEFFLAQYLILKHKFLLIFHVYFNNLNFN